MSDATPGEQPTSALVPPTVTPATANTPPARPGVWPTPFTYGRVRPISTPVPPPVTPFSFPSDAVNILLMGSDRRSGRYYRTDTLIVLSISPSAGAAVLVSIPRDLYVYLPGYTMQRVNTAMLYGELYDYPGGGIAMLYDTLLYNLGIPIDHYARIEMSGFSDLVDTIGGVEVHVTCPYTDWRLKEPDLPQNVVANWELFTVSSGVVPMDGDYALWYARSRKRSSDFDRSRRQQEVLRAIYRKIMSLDLVPRLPTLYQNLTSMVTTDMTLADLVALAPMALRTDLSQVRSRFIGRDQVTSWRTPTGAAVVVPKPDAIRELLAEAFDFEQVDLLEIDPIHSAEVLNASSHPDWDMLAAERLIYYGYETSLLTDTPEPDTPTHVIDFGLAPAGEILRIQQALGLSTDMIARLPNAESPVAFRLVIGNDYDPCFNPTRDQGD
ncbi:MAG: LCP family protein [Anaerolineales bacterium]|jgi:LCP family protein required for cell wall assembly